MMNEISPHGKATFRDRVYYSETVEVGFFTRLWRTLFPKVETRYRYRVKRTSDSSFTEEEFLSHEPVDENDARRMLSLVGLDYRVNIHPVKVELLTEIITLEADRRMVETVYGPEVEV